VSETPAATVVENLAEARFECVFPTCGGICCRNGRPGVDPGEGARIEANLAKFVGELRPEARRLVEQRGFLTRRVKAGRRTLAVVKGWCVFFNEGCVLHKAGAREGDRWRYKPWRCVTFPLERAGAKGRWFVRQWKLRGEAWDLFCLNPKESPKRASQTLAGEVEFAKRLDRGAEDWRERSPRRLERPRTPRSASGR
jgi:hypothetical protein